MNDTASTLFQKKSIERGMHSPESFRRKIIFDIMDMMNENATGIPSSMIKIPNGALHLLL
jgi:hypothetical protein